MSIVINPVTITDKALEEIRDIQLNKKIPEGYRLRVGIKGGVGCAGVNYVIGFDEKTVHDNEFDMRGGKVLIDKRHTMFLMGVTLDFYEGADARGFRFVRPENLP